MFRSIVFLVIVTLAANAHAERDPAAEQAARARADRKAADNRVMEKCISSSLRATQNIGIAIHRKGIDPKADAKALISTGQALYDCRAIPDGKDANANNCKGDHCGGGGRFSGGGASGSYSGGSSGGGGNWGSSNGSPRK